MARLDGLPAPQRDVLQLVLQYGSGYDEIATTLGIDRGAVRERALAALESLAPGTDVPQLQRALITDYLLGQLPPRLASQVRARLESSAAERDWAAAVATELEPLASGRLPEIPSGSAAGPTGVVGPAEPGSAPPGRDGEAPGERPRTSRRGGAVLLGVAAALVVAAVVVVIVVLGGGSSSGGRRAAASPASTTPATTTPAATKRTTTTPATRVHQVNLTAPGGARRPIGVAQVLRQGKAIGLAIVAAGMPANTPTNAYGVWLSGPGGHSKFLGFAPKRVGRSGRLTVTSRLLPGDARSFRRLLITVETTAHPKSPGRVLLSGAFKVP